jgi:hypothetical protein
VCDLKNKNIAEFPIIPNILLKKASFIVDFTSIKVNSESRKIGINKPNKNDKTGFHFPSLSLNTENNHKTGIIDAENASTKSLFLDTNQGSGL